KVYISGRWIGHYNDDKDNNFCLHFDQEKEGSDVNGDIVYTRLNKSSKLDMRHIIFCVITDKRNKDCHDGCKDFRGVISAEGSKIVGTYDKGGKTVGTFTMEKRPLLTMHHVNTELEGEWTGCYDDDEEENRLKITFDGGKGNHKLDGVIGKGKIDGNPIWIILRIIDFFKHKIIVCAVSRVGQTKCEGNCTDFQMTMVSSGMIQGEYKDQDGQGTFRLYKTTQKDILG
ncbi:Hypothetical predicted protein, partial [Mytilus galloprovincialis]